MRKLRILLSALSFSVACADLMAQNVPVQTVTDPGNSAVAVPVEVPQYSSIPPELLLKNAITNPDGSRTIKAGQQTAEANAMNRRYCGLIGGIDVTNERDQTTGAEMLYTVVCQSGPAHRAPAIATAIFRMGTEPPLSQMSGPVHSPTIPPPDSENGMQRNPFGKK